MNFILKPKKVALYLGTIIACLILANIVGILCRHFLGITSSYAIQLFNLANEHNVPTYYATIQLLCCALLLGLIAISKKQQATKGYGHWLGLMGLFLFLSIDEAIEIHERISLITRNQLNTTGIFYFAWTIPYALLVLAIAAIYLPFLLRLPKQVKVMVFAAGTIYVAGALGMEVLESYYHWETQEKNVYFAVMVTIEESMEMLGILLFLLALLHYIRISFSGITLHLNPAASSKAVEVRQNGTFTPPRDRQPAQNYNTYKTAHPGNKSNVELP